MKWIEDKDEWHMVIPKELTRKDDDLLYNFLDCANIKRIFEEPSKHENELFIINVKRYKKRTNITI